MFHFYLILGYILTALSREISSELTRKVNTTCICSKDGNKVFYSTAKGSHDMLHYIFATQGQPTMIVLKSINATLEFNCSLFFEGEENKSITISEQPQYLYGFTFRRILQYDDTEDKASLSLTGNFSWTDLGTLDWHQNFDHETNYVQWSVTSNTTDFVFMNGGSLNLTFQINSDDGESLILPHLDYNANTCQGLFILNQVYSQFQRSRFAVELAMFTSDAHPHNTLTTKKSVDDGHTPGVFKIVDWTVSGVSQKSGAFVQWKPICYTQPDASMKFSTTISNYALESSSKGLNSSLASAARAMLNYTNVVLTNVSFGLSGDGFYKSTNYSSWSFTVGYGRPPSDGISLTILLIVIIGLGLPFCMLIIGFIYVCIRNCRSAHRSGYVSIQ